MRASPLSHRLGPSKPRRATRRYSAAGRCKPTFYCVRRAAPTARYTSSPYVVSKSYFFIDGHGLQVFQRTVGRCFHHKTRPEHALAPPHHLVVLAAPAPVVVREAVDAREVICRPSTDASEIVFVATVAVPDARCAGACLPMATRRRPRLGRLRVVGRRRGRSASRIGPFLPGSRPR